MAATRTFERQAETQVMELLETMSLEIMREVPFCSTHK